MYEITMNVCVWNKTTRCRDTVVKRVTKRFKSAAEMSDYWDKYGKTEPIKKDKEKEGN